MSPTTPDPARSTDQSDARLVVMAGVIRACPGCRGTMIGRGRYAVSVAGGEPCNRCLARQIGPAAAAFASFDLELLGQRVAALPRGRQRETAALLLADAAALILEETASRPPSRNRTRSTR